MYKKEQVKRVTATDGEIVILETPVGRIEIVVGSDKFSPAPFRVQTERKFEVTARDNGEYAPPDRFFYDFA